MLQATLNTLLDLKK